VGEKHYALKDNMLNFEMYARKVPLLQVLKYMPQSIELTAAMEASRAAEEGRTITSTAPPGSPPTTRTTRARRAADRDRQAGAVRRGLQKKAAGWKKAIEGGKSVADVIATAETKNTLTADQKMEIASWAQPPTTEGAAS
jgi:recombination protein RecT